MYLLRHSHIVDADAHKLAHAAVVFAHGLGIVAPVGAEVQRGKYPRAHAAIARGKRVARADLIRAHIDESVMVILCKGHGTFLSKTKHLLCLCFSLLVSAAALFVFKSAGAVGLHLAAGAGIVAPGLRHP